MRVAAQQARLQQASVAVAKSRQSNVLRSGTHSYFLTVRARVSCTCSTYCAQAHACISSCNAFPQIRLYFFSARNEEKLDR